MRDPDLVGRARRAATALELAWHRWRTIHGLGADPLPPVSSYVGYSLEEPWGQPRVVFGVDAEEAEQLAALLNGHDCAGRARAQAAGSVPQGPDQAAEWVHVPAQAGASAGEQAPGDHSARRYAEQDFGGQQYAGQDFASQQYAGQDFGGQQYGRQPYAAPQFGAGTPNPSPVPPEPVEFRPDVGPMRVSHAFHPAPAWPSESGAAGGEDEATEWAEPSVVAFRPRPEPTGYPDYGYPAEGQHERGDSSMSADVAGWISGELPGQAAATDTAI
jgi:hypothetical protein